MARYEFPELFAIGTVEAVVLGDKDRPDNDSGDDPLNSRMDTSVLDVD